MTDTRRTMDPILLVGSIILIAAVLTWIVPAGQYQRTADPATGRTLVVPNSFHSAPQHPVGPWGVLLSIPQGLIGAAAVVFYVLLAGGALTVVEATGAIGNTLDHLVARFGHRPQLVVMLCCILFMIGGATYSMYEEILAFIPLLCVLMKRLRLENSMAMGISLGTACVAATFSPVNTFLLGISQPVVQVPLFSGFGLRAVGFVLAMGIWVACLLWHASRQRALAPADDDQLLHPVHPGKWRKGDIAVLIILNAGMASLVVGAVFLNWELLHFSAMFVAIGFCAGLAGGLGWRGTSINFAEGFRRLAFASMLVGFARAISVVLENGMILDTIANFLFSPLRHLPTGVASVLMLASESVLSVPMPSDSGKAMATLPILIPLADLLGISRQMVASAYQFSCLAGFFVPTAGSMLAMLALAGVPYGKWLRFVAVPFTALFVLQSILMLVGVMLHVQ
jgi:uncharacterized ion transporter superfamily protein YfcC